MTDTNDDIDDQAYLIALRDRARNAEAKALAQRADANTYEASDSARRALLREKQHGGLTRTALLNARGRVHESRRLGLLPNGSPPIAGGSFDLDEQRASAEVDADTIGPDTIHKCAGGCGFLVRHGEPHICEPMCNCRPRTRVLGTPWNHTPGCAFEVEPDLRLKHRCSDCPPDTDKARDDARTQDIVASAHRLAAAGDTAHAALNGDAAGLLDAARSRLALTNRDVRLLLWRAEAIRLLGHHDYVRGFKVDDLITPAALAEAIQLRSTTLDENGQPVTVLGEGLLMEGWHTIEVEFGEPRPR